jgi:hypothetical protein
MAGVSLDKLYGDCTEVLLSILQTIDLLRARWRPLRARARPDPALQRGHAGSEAVQGQSGRAGGSH